MRGKKKEFWTDQQVMAVIRVLEEMQVIQMFDNKRYRTKDIFDKVEAELREMGIKKAASQIQVKYKSLKGKFRRGYDLRLRPCTRLRSRANKIIC